MTETLNYEEDIDVKNLYPLHFFTIFKTIFFIFIIMKLKENIKDFFTIIYGALKKDQSQGGCDHKAVILSKSGQYYSVLNGILTQKIKRVWAIEGFIELPSGVRDTERSVILFEKKEDCEKLAHSNHILCVDNFIPEDNSYAVKIYITKREVDALSPYIHHVWIYSNPTPSNCKIYKNFEEYIKEFFEEKAKLEKI